MSTDTIKEFFKKGFNVDAEKMLIGEIINVSSFNRKVLSFNEKNNTNEFKKVLNIIRKKDDYMYLTSVGGEILENQEYHKFYVKMDLDKSATYFTVKDLHKYKKPFFMFNKDFEWVQADGVKRANKKIKIFDFEVESNHNYYSNNFLSHNTIFGNPETTTGGNALKFYSSQRLDIRRIGQNKGKDDEVTANKVRVKVVKNKVAPPFRQAEFEIKFGIGIDKISEMIDLAVQLEIIKKSGSWFSYDSSKLGQGVENVRLTLVENPDLYDIIEKAVKDCIYED